MNHRRVQRRREPDGGRVEGVIVDHVIPELPHAHISEGESALGRRWFRPFWPERTVKRVRQRPGIDSGVDHLDPRDLRPGGGVNVDFVPPAD